LQSGQIDFSDNLDTADLETLKGNSKLHTQADIGEWFNMIYFNLSQKPLDDPRVRVAINMALDRDELIAGVADGEGEPAWLPVPKAQWSYDPTGINAWPHDIDAAKKLMADAGYATGAKMTLVTTPDAPSAREAEIVKSQLAKIGMDVQVTTMDSNQAISQYFEAQAFNSSLLAWSGRPDPGQTYLRLFAKDTYQNPGKVAIPGLDDAMAKAVATDDLTQRAAAYAAANKILNAAAPYAPLFYRPDVTSYATKVQGYSASLLGKPKVEYLWLSD
jgi:peptide/nickel transport system substrate-binding protein